MNPTFYNIISSEEDGPYLYELVESGGRQGVRCRIYVSAIELYKNCFDLYTSKQVYNIQKMLKKRHQIASHKFESIVWCWPYDKFDYEVGKEMSRERVDEKIKSKKKRINCFLKNLERHNLPKTVIKKLEDVRNS